MMRLTSLGSLCLIVLIGSLSIAGAQSGSDKKGAPSESDKKIEKKALDVVANGKLLNTHFSRYGFQPLRTIKPDWGGVRIHLPETEKKTEQTGIYSYFAMAGDFEVTAGFELFDLPAAGAGYGASVGIGVDTDPPDNLKLSLHRGNYPKRGSGFWVTMATEKGEKKENDTRFFLGEGESGKLILKREKDEVSCLVADDYTKNAKELVRLPFTGKSIRVVRAFVDNGGTNSELDVRVVGLKLTADQMTGGIPEAEEGGYGWLIWIFGPIGLAVLGFAFWKQRAGA